MLLDCGVGEDSWESFGLQGDPSSSSQKKSVLNVHWKDWCWSWNSKTLATWCEELIHLKRLWCWERLKVRGEGNNRGWDGWMVSLSQGTWVFVNSGRPGMLQSMGSQIVGHDWAAELNSPRMGHHVIFNVFGDNPSKNVYYLLVSMQNVDSSTLGEWLNNKSYGPDPVLWQRTLRI